jgi:hypothetical protein
MKRISFVVAKDYQNNKIFNLEDKNLNRDNCLYPYFLLREGFRSAGFELLTSDLLPPSEADIVIYNEMPKPFMSNIDKEKSYLLIFESELIRKDNWDLDKHKFFKKIFTWNDDLVDGKKYLKFNFPNTFITTPPGLAGRNTLLTLISGNKSCLHSKELYSERLKTIKWFEKNHPSDFHYYGIGWDYPFNVWFQKVFRKLKILNYIPKVKSKCFQGRVEQKLPTLQKYKFAVCYENAKEINGYITEKIFDCFFAGCIPVYWGPDNIEKFIPADCFIDRRIFKSQEEMYNFLAKMSDQEILSYQNKINQFLQSDLAALFSDTFFANNIIKNVTNE